MTAPRQMTANTLNALKGWPAPAALDFNTTYDPTMLTQQGTVLAGTVCHLSDAGQYLLGVGKHLVMPLFMFHNSDDPDVNNDGGDASTVRGVFVPISPTGQAMSLVGSGAYELVSTQFVSATYYPNDKLTSPTYDLDSTNCGKLKKGTYGTDMICGITSRGVIDNGYGNSALAFWPVIIPNTTGNFVAGNGTATLSGGSSAN